MSDVNKPDNGDSQKPNTLLSLQAPRFGEMQNGAPRSSRTMATVSLAVALVAGAVVLYVWKEMEQARTTAALSQDDLADRIHDLESANSARHAELEQARQGNEDMARQNAAMKNSLDELRTRVTRDRGEWLLAETEFLLSTANRKLRFDRDVNAATAALEEADDRLQMLNDPSLVPVRTLIARDVQALRRVPHIDRTSLALELSALIQASNDLPLALGLAAPAPTAADKAERPVVTGWRDFFPALWADIRGLVTIHRLDHAVTPLLPPEQQFVLRQNLGLKLDVARVALLQRESAAYQGALREAQEWLGRYFKADAPAVRAAQEQVTRLRAVEIAPPLPDIGDSLRQLRRLKRQLDTEVRVEGER